jgi:prefoldin beta subunit
MNSLGDKVFQDYQQIRSRLNKAIGQRQQLEAQLKENEVVQKELQVLSAQADVFKLVGPTLLKQERNDAISHVKTRLEFIRNEIQKLEAELKDLEVQEQAMAKQVIQAQGTASVSSTSAQ